jgi:hypothetical protein
MNVSKNALNKSDKDHQMNYVCCVLYSIFMKLADFEKK